MMKNKKMYYNGNIVTLSDKGVCDSIITDGSRIEWVGKKEEVDKLARSECVKIDLNGKTMIPSFIDSHSHIVQLAESLRFVSLAECKTFDDIIKLLTEYKVRNNLNENSWIIGFGYDDNKLDEQRHPDKNVLNKVSKSNPVLISHISGHMGCVNEAALKRTGISEMTEDPPGGVIGRVNKTKEPNGYLEEKAFINISGKIPKASEDEMLKLIDKAQNIYASYGIATAQEGLMKENEFRLLKKSSDKNRLFLDIIGYADIKDSAYTAENNPKYRSYVNHFKIGGYKLFLDGSPQGRTAWMTEPYYIKGNGQPDDYCGYPIYNDKTVKDFVRKAAEDKFQLLTHCNGDAAIDQLIKAHDGVASEYRNVIIHAQMMRNDQLEKAKELKLIPSFFAAHIFYWGDTHIKNFGSHRADYISPARSAEKLGIPFTFHQDTPVLPPDMTDTIFCAVNRITRNGIQLSESEKISVISALKAVTANSAYQYHEEHIKGTLESGKNADISILDGDITQCSNDEIKNIKVCETIKDGISIYTMPR